MSGVGRGEHGRKKKKEDVLVEVQDQEAERRFMLKWAQEHPLEYAQGMRPLPAFKKKIPLSAVQNEIMQDFSGDITNSNIEPEVSSHEECSLVQYLHRLLQVHF